HGERLGQFETLSSRPAQRIGAAFDVAAEAHKFKRCARLLPGKLQLRLPAAPAEESAHRNVVEHGKAREGPHDLKGASDAQSRATKRRQRRDGRILQAHFARAGRKRAAYHADESRLARAVWAD